MFYARNDLPCALCGEAKFHAVDENRSAGFIRCDHARIAVQFQLDPQPHLTFYPPLRLPDDAAAGRSFLSWCMDQEDDEWFDFEFSPISGQISWRRDLSTAEPEAIDAALADARSFFSDEWPKLERAVARCGTRPRRRSAWRRFLDSFMEV